MNIHEYQAKEILKGYGVRIQEGIVIDSVDNAISAAEQLKAQTGTGWFVVKAQIHAGGRGKGGGVKVANHCFTPADIAATAAKPIKRYWSSPEEETEIIRWVRTADLSDAAPVDVPWVWTGFIFLADEMLRQGLGKTHCIQCDQTYSATALTAEDTKRSGVSGQKCLRCPAGHTVLAFQNKKTPS